MLATTAAVAPLQRGLAYQAMQMWDDAVRDMDRVLKRQPDNIAALTGTARCCADHGWREMTATMRQAWIPRRTPQ